MMYFQKGGRQEKGIRHQWRTNHIPKIIVFLILYYYFSRRDFLRREEAHSQTTLPIYRIDYSSRNRLARKHHR
jgi:hypothetical protein